MPEFVPIYKGRDFYVPAFDIKIDGKSLPHNAAKDVTDVSYTDNIDQIDTFDLTISNWDAEKRDFKYTGSIKGAPDGDKRKLFEPGQKIELWMGYFKPTAAAHEQRHEPELLRLMLVGIITSLTPNFPAGGQPTLRVSGQNVLRQLLTRQETHHYTDKTDSEIAEIINQRGNLRIGDLQVPIRIDGDAKSNKEPRHAHVLQDNQYDILFLIQRARLNGYDVLLKYESQDREPRPFLYFGPSTKEPRVAYILEWGKSLIQFQPTLTTTRQVSAVRVRSWNPLTKSPIDVTVNRNELENRSLRDQEQLQRIEQGFNERREIIADRPFRDDDEARSFARDRLERLAKDMVTGQGATIGTPDLRAGSIIEMRGLGPTFEGNYFVKSSTHAIGGSGYTTNFEARLEEKNA